MTPRIWKFFLLLLLLLPSAIVAAGPLSLKGRILDGSGRPVGGAEVYVFDSANVKRPADFISEKSGSDGHYQLALPPGRYWTMAIQRQGEARVGPLGPNDRFSGEPLLFEGGADKQVANDFTVISLKEAALRNRKRNEELIKVTGRILDPSGVPVAGAYVMADSAPTGQLPLYLSTWSEADGLYTLFLPKGKIFLGVARAFPPGSDYHLDREADFNDDAVGEDLVAPPVAAKGIAPATEER
jgi:hypothetical protein